MLDGSMHIAGNHARRATISKRPQKDDVKHLGAKGPVNKIDTLALKQAASEYFVEGLAEGTRRAYDSAKKRYVEFCRQGDMVPLPLTEDKSCYFAAYLAKQGLAPQTVTSYLAAIRHLQICAGLGAPVTAQWPRLHYTVRGIKRSGAGNPKKPRLPITPAILNGLCRVWSAGKVETGYDARLLWAACCLGYFGFLRAGEFTAASLSSPPGIRVSDVAVDSHESPSVLRVHLRKAKTDPFGKGVEIYLGKTGLPLCPVVALTNFMARRPPGLEDGPLLVWQDLTPLTKDRFVAKVRKALALLGIDQRSYSGHSFRIGAATTAAAAGVPAHLIKAMGRWSSEAYLIYIRETRESLSSVSGKIAQTSQVGTGTAGMPVVS